MRSSILIGALFTVVACSARAYADYESYDIPWPPADGNGANDGDEQSTNSFAKRSVSPELNEFESINIPWPYSESPSTGAEGNSHNHLGKRFLNEFESSDVPWATAGSPYSGPDDISKSHFAKREAEAEPEPGIKREAINILKREARAIRRRLKRSVADFESDSAEPNSDDEVVPEYIDDGGFSPAEPEPTPEA